MRKLRLLPSVSTLMVAVTSALLVSCAAQDDAVPPGGTNANGTGVGGGGVGGSDEGPCSTDGERRECSVHNAYGCLAGTQTCEGGTWSECVLGAATEDRILRPSGDGPRLRTPRDTGNEAETGADEAEDGRVGHPGGVTNRLGEACDVDSDCLPVLEYCAASDTCQLVVPCLGLLDCPAGEYCGNGLFCSAIASCGEDGTTANPCDPECHAVNPESTDFGGSGVAYGAGTFASYPPAFMNAGLPNNCNEGANQNDCQFDHYCAPNGNGECLPWPLGGTDAACAGQVNVTIGPPCTDGIPVCNRGTVPVEDDFHLDHSSAAGASEINSGDPNLSGGGNNCDYEVAVFGEIQPGECVMLPFDCGTPADTSDDFLPGELITAHNPNNECNDGDNFGYYPTTLSACGGPTCGGGVNLAGTVDLSLFVYADRSGSMDDDIGGGPNEKVNTVCRGLEAFVETPANAGIRWEYKEWPDENGTYVGPSMCDRTGGCWGTDWLGREACFASNTAPLAPQGRWSMLSTLPGDSSGFQMPCNDMLPIGATATYQSGTAGASARTPLLYTLRGARHAARIEKQNNPDRAVVIVLVTDADEIGGTHPCGATPLIQTEVTNARVVDGVFTAVVGVGIATGGAAETQANDIANWGGTGTAILLPGSGSPALLNAAMQSIRNSFSCSRTVPDPLPAGVSITDIDVTWNSGGGPVTLTLVGGVGGDATDCTGATNEFYYDGAGTITLCPATCTATSVVNTNVEFTVPCGPQVVPVTGSDGFAVPAGTCPQGSIPKWTQLLSSGGSYAGLGSITVEAHTKILAGDTYTTEWAPIGTITSDGTMDLFEPLDDYNLVRNPAITPVQGYGEGIELRFTSTPGSVCGGLPVVCVPVAPDLGDYEVHFTCEATE